MSDGLRKFLGIEVAQSGVSKARDGHRVARALSILDQFQASVFAGIPHEEATVQFRKRLTDGGLGEFATKIQVQPI